MTIDPSKALSDQRNLSRVQNAVCAGVAYHRRDGFDVDAYVEDVECAVTAVETFIPQTDHRFFHMLRYVSLLVFDKIAHSDGSGCCDKPADMPRFRYWFQRLDISRIEEAIESLAEKPPVRVFEINKKPPSSSPKCFKCKAKFARDEQMVLDRNIRVPMYPEGLPYFRPDLHRRWHARCAGEPPVCR